MCSFKPWLSVTNVREHTGQCCSTLSSFLVEDGREELVPPDWNRSDLPGPSPRQGSLSSWFSPRISPLVLRRLLGLVCASVGSKNCSGVKPVSYLFA